MNRNTTKDQLAATSTLIDEIKALRDSSEELFILLEHIWHNRDDWRFKVSVVLTGQGREALAETLSCYACEMESLDSLAQALHDGWIDVEYCAEEERSSNFVGWCPGCQRAHEEQERRLNEDPHDQPVAIIKPATKAAGEQRAESVAPNLREAELPSKTATGKIGAAPVEAANNALIDSSSNKQAEGSVVPSPQVAVSASQDPNRKQKPLYLRLYLHRHLEEIVRAIGYDVISREEGQRRLSPLIDRYGRATIEPAAEELLAPDVGTAEATLQLRPEVRSLAWQLLGPPPAKEYDAPTAPENQKGHAASDNRRS